MYCTKLFNSGSCHGRYTSNVCPHCEPAITELDRYRQFAQNIVDGWQNEIDSDTPISGTEAVSYIVKLVSDAKHLLNTRVIEGAICNIKR